MPFRAVMSIVKSSEQEELLVTIVIPSGLLIPSTIRAEQNLGRRGPPRTPTSQRRSRKKTVKVTPVTRVGSYSALEDLPEDNEPRDVLQASVLASSWSWVAGSPGGLFRAL